MDAGQSCEHSWASVALAAPGSGVGGFHVYLGQFICGYIFCPWQFLNLHQLPGGCLWPLKKN